MLPLVHIQVVGGRRLESGGLDLKASGGWRPSKFLGLRIPDKNLLCIQHFDLNRCVYLINTQSGQSEGNWPLSGWPQKWNGPQGAEFPCLLVCVPWFSHIRRHGSASCHFGNQYLGNPLTSGSVLFTQGSERLGLSIHMTFKSIEILWITPNQYFQSFI
jgi:hypothetical protein